MEANIRLPETTALPGPIRLYPPQRGIADAISDPLIERVSVLKSARIGYTTLLIGAIANHVKNDPAPILVVRPTDTDCEAMVTSDLEPTFQASPSLRGSLSGDMLEINRNTMLSRRFPGGSLKVVAARSPNNLSDKTARVLILDEVDRMPVTHEGDPIALAIMRTQSFPDRKILMGSTPSLTDTSNIIKAYQESDKRVYEVLCPHCSAFSEVLWENIDWPKGKPEEVRWYCPACGAACEEHLKTAMVAAGRWTITAPEVKGHAGFKINALTSALINATWAKLAAEWDATEQDVAKRQVFVNTVLGEGWKEAGEEIDDVALASKVEPFGLTRLPEAVLSITCGVDVQHDRLEATFLGWSSTGAMFVLGHKVIYGHWESDDPWAELDELLKTRWPHPYGGTLGVDAAAIDSGDGKTQQAVYDFTAPRTNKKIMAIKGTDHEKVWILKSGQKKQRAPLWLVASNPVKRHIMDRIKAALKSPVKEESLFRFSDDLEESWFEQLAGERLVIRMIRSRPKAQFVPISGRRHEALDCTVYGIAASKVLTINFMEREQQLRRPDVKPVKKSRVTSAKKLDHSSQF